MSCRQSKNVIRSRSVPGELLRARDVERDSLGEARVGGEFAGDLDRLGVVVVAGERARGVGLGHQHRKVAVAAPDVRDPGPGVEFRVDAVERREPFADQAGRVAGSEEPGGATEQRGRMLIPADPAAVAEGLGQPGPDLRGRGEGLEATDHAGRA
jgi:hypothetical protein